MNEWSFESKLTWFYPVRLSLPSWLMYFIHYWLATNFLPLSSTNHPQIVNHIPAILSLLQKGFWSEMSRQDKSSTRQSSSYKHYCLAFHLNQSCRRSYQQGVDRQNTGIPLNIIGFFHLNQSCRRSYQQGVERQKADIPLIIISPLQNKPSRTLLKTWAEKMNTCTLETQLLPVLLVFCER